MRFALSILSAIPLGQAAVTNHVTNSTPVSGSASAFSVLPTYEHANIVDNDYNTYFRSSNSPTTGDTI